MGLYKPEDEVGSVLQTCPTCNGEGKVLRDPPPVVVEPEPAPEPVTEEQAAAQQASSDAAANPAAPEPEPKHKAKHKEKV